MKSAAGILCVGMLLSLNAVEIPLSSENWKPIAPEQRKQILLSGAAGKTPEAVLDLQLRPSRFHYAEFYCPNPFPIASSRASFHGKISFDLMLNQESDFRCISIRLLDKDGETFHYSAFPKIKKDQWIPVVFDLSPKIRFLSSWGKKKNGMIDYPVSFAGLSVDFNKKSDRDIRFRIKNMRWEPSPLPPN